MKFYGTTRFKRPLNFFQKFIESNSMLLGNNFDLATPVKSLFHPQYCAIYKHKKQLLKVFSRIENNELVNIICLPSLTFNKGEIENIVGVEHYQTRSLWNLLMAKHSNIKITFVTSVDLNDDILNYYFSFLPNKDDVRKRVKIIKTKNIPGRSLVENILRDKHSLTELNRVVGKNNCFMLSFLSSPLESELASKLDIPIWGSHDELLFYQTKSGNRTIFEKARVPFADGVNNIHTEADLIHAITEMKSKYPDINKLMVKLNLGVSGDGNAILRFPDNFVFASTQNSRFKQVKDLLNQMKFQAHNMDWKQFKRRLKNGGIVELFLDGEDKSSPSAQGRIHPSGYVEIISTHEQILDSSGMKYLGSRFPSNIEFRNYIKNQALKIGIQLKEKGILGHFSVDFLVSTTAKARSCHAIEINIRQGGTTHPYQMAKLITDARYCEENDELIDKKGRSIHYRSNDNLLFDYAYENGVMDFIDYIKNHNIAYENKRGSGVVFHLLSAFENYGKLGYTAIAFSPEEAENLSEHVMRLSKQYQRDYGIKLA